MTYPPSLVDMYTLACIVYKNVSRSPQHTDNEAAARLNEARQRLFQSIFNRSRAAA